MLELQEAQEVIEAFLLEPGMEARYARFIEHRLSKDRLLYALSRSSDVAQAMHDHQKSADFMRLALLRAYEAGVKDQQDGFNLSEQETPDLTDLEGTSESPLGQQPPEDDPSIQ